MSSPASLTFQLPGKRDVAQVLQVARHEILRLSRGRHVVGWGLFLFLPAMVLILRATFDIGAAGTAFSEPLVVGTEAPRAASAELYEVAWVFRMFTLPFVTFLAAAGLFGNAFRAEVAERTLHHLFLQPVRREILVAGKYVGNVAALTVLLTFTWLLGLVAALLPHGPRALVATVFSGDGLQHVFATLLVILLAVTSYGALFLLVGLLIRSPIGIGAVVFLWERATTFLPQGCKDLTLIHHLDSLLPVRIAPDWLLATVSEPSSWPVALLVPLVVAGLSLAAATAWSRRLDLAYGTSE